MTAVKYSFTGQFDAYQAIPRRIADTQGWLELIVGTDGSTNMTAVSILTAPVGARCSVQRRTEQLVHRVPVLRCGRGVERRVVGHGEAVERPGT